MSKFYTRQRDIAASLLASLTEKVLRKKCPLDRELQAVMRANRGWGSKDRRFYSETVFCFFRWYGWVRKAFSGSASTWNEDVWCDIVDLCQQLNQCNDISSAQDLFSLKFPETEFDSSMLLPNGIKELFCDDDAAYVRFLEAQQSRPPVWLRCRDKKAVKQLTSELSKFNNITFEVNQSAPLAVKVVGRFNINGLPAFKDGLVEIQDFASQCIGLVAAPRDGEKWLDTCSGAGGKTLQLAAMMNDSGRIVACDVRDAALRELRKRALKHGLRSIFIQKNDFLNSSSKLDGKSFDGVLVDAPCSNSGTWRRNPALRWSFSQKVSEIAAEIQLKILLNAAECVKPGGVLVYSTCSASILENQDVVKAFLEQKIEFSGDTFKNPVTGVDCDTSLFLPFDLADNDSMFVARFVRSK